MKKKKWRKVSDTDVTEPLETMRSAERAVNEVRSRFIHWALGFAAKLARGELDLGILRVRLSPERRTMSDVWHDRPRRVRLIVEKR